MSFDAVTPDQYTIRSDYKIRQFYLLEGGARGPPNIKHNTRKHNYI